jgi:predicted O-methyltransferase YrrM
MTARSAFLDERVQKYIVSATVDEHPLLARLRAETAPMPNAGMQIGADQGRFMQWLAQTIGARRYVEIGVFTGYSALSLALALPIDGKILACDISESYTAIARRYWREAGVEEKIDLRLAPALETLDDAIQHESGSYDLAFIDADKENVDTYYERCLRLLRTGGVIMIDNVLWDGRVADPSENDLDTAALRAINAKASRDPRVDASLLSIGDGLLLARKR